MYEHCFSKLTEVMRKERKEPKLHLTSFTRHLVWPLGVASLPLTLMDHQTHVKNTQTRDFTIIQSPSPYNIIFGRSVMKRFEVIAYTIHGLVRFKTLRGYGTVCSKPLVIPTLMLIAKEGTPKTDEQT